MDTNIKDIYDRALSTTAELCDLFDSSKSGSLTDTIRDRRTRLFMDTTMASQLLVEYHPEAGLVVEVLKDVQYGYRIPTYSMCEAVHESIQAINPEGDFDPKSGLERYLIKTTEGLKGRESTLKAIGGHLRQMSLAYGLERESFKGESDFDPKKATLCSYIFLESRKLYANLRSLNKSTGKRKGHINSNLNYLILGAMMVNSGSYLYGDEMKGFMRRSLEDLDKQMRGESSAEMDAHDKLAEHIQKLLSKS